MTKALIRTLALWLALWPSLVVAQQYPTVPDHTVVGRVGTGSGSGPAQAIPFTTLYGQLTGAVTAAQNQIPVYPGANGQSVPTSPTTWFDSWCGATVGFIMARTTGGWACNPAATVDAGWWGVKCDGTTDNTTALNAALAAVQTVRLPAGNCKHSGTIILSRTDVNYLIGQGIGVTILTNTGNAVSVEPTIATPPSFWGVKSMTVDFTGTRSGNSDGIYSAGALSNVAMIEDVLVQNHDTNLHLGPVVWGWVRSVFIQGGRVVNFIQQGTSTNGGLHWQLNNVLSQESDGDGFSVLCLAGSTQCTVGEWTDVTCFANTGHGMKFVGVNTAPIFNIRVKGAFCGQDSGSEIYLDTFGDLAGSHLFTNVDLELAGTIPTGSSLATAASNVGHGFEFTTNANVVQIDGAWINGMSQDGIKSDAKHLIVTNSTVVNNGGALGSGTRIGILLNSGSSIIQGNKICNSTGGTTQQVGVSYTSSSAANILQGNDFSCGSANSSNNIVDSSIGTGYFTGNLGNNLASVVASANIGTSPVTITAGHQRETHYLKQTATNTATCTQGGQAIVAMVNASTLYMIDLDPGESYICTWSTTNPTVTKVLH